MEGYRMTREYDGLRTFLGKCEEFGEIRTISGADWELEIGALTESTSELIPEPPALMFDEVKGYPKGFRVLSLPVASRVRTALALGLPTDLKPMELVREASRRVKNAERVPPKEVETGPVMQNVMRDNEVDLLKFPAIRAHKGDGGRYGFWLRQHGNVPNSGARKEPARPVAEPRATGPPNRRALLEER